MFAEQQYEHTKGWANEMNNNVPCSLLFVLYDKSLYGYKGCCSAGCLTTLSAVVGSAHMYNLTSDTAATASYDDTANLML